MGTAGQGRPHPIRAWTFFVAVVAAWLVSHVSVASAQQVDFQIVWVVVGEAAGGDAKRSARAGKQLFMASDLVQWSLEAVKVARVDATPVVIELKVGEEFCLGSLNLRAYDAKQQPVNGAPMSVSMRQDQKEKLGLRRSRHDICAKPSEAGEFPVRFTSLLPAPDGTMRGAQIFVRAADDAAASQ